MRIIFPGTGSAFTLKNYQTNLIIQHNHKSLLVDAGSDIRFSMKVGGMIYKDIDSIFITHIHADHVGGLEYFAFSTYFDPSCKEKISLIGNNEVLRNLWNTSLKGGLQSIQAKRMTLDEYFDVEMIKKNNGFTWEGIFFQMVQTVHIVDEFAIVPSFGLMFTSPDSQKRYYFTSDTQYCPHQIMDFYKMSDVIIQDCETTPFKSGVHANFADLKQLPLDVKNKMHLVHYQDNILDDNCNIKDEWQKEAQENGFIGFVKKGHILEEGTNSQ